MSTPIRTSDPIPCLDARGMHLTIANTGRKTAIAVSVPRGRERTVVTFHIGADAREELASALLDWRFVDEELPDDDVQVCVAVRDPDGECYFFLGHHSGTRWVCEDELETPFAGEVYAWAHVPAVPRHVARKVPCPS